MFELAVSLIVLICAVPLCLAVVYGIHFIGLSMGLAATLGALLFLVSSAMVIHGLVLKNRTVA